MRACSDHNGEERTMYFNTKTHHPIEAHHIIILPNDYTDVLLCIFVKDVGMKV